MQIAQINKKFNFHPAASEETANRHSAIRLTCLRAALALNDIAPECDEKEEAIKKLEEVMFWANAALARNSLVKPS